MKIYMSREAFRQMVGIVPQQDAQGMQVCGLDGTVYMEYVFTDCPTYATANEPPTECAPTAAEILDCAELDRIFNL